MTHSVQGTCSLILHTGLGLSSAVKIFIEKSLIVILAV